jgi:DNA-directed RNA polymerase specialized sigma subunit
MREIGAALDVSESRISQILSAVLARLGDTLRGREAEFLEVDQ